jgi:hypothetical protein
VATVIIVVAVVVPLMAVVVDLGLTRVLSGRARNAADAGALAAAAVLTLGRSADQARTAAQDAVAANLAAPDGTTWPQAWASCVDVSPLPDGTPPAPGNCVTIDTALKQVRVTVPPRSVPVVFAGAAGNQAMEATATSTATWADKIAPADGTCALCVLGSYYSGWERVAVSGGDAAVRTSLTLVRPGGLRVTGGGGVTFGTWWSANSTRIVSPLPVARPMQDPFATALTTLQASVPYGQPSAPTPALPCGPGVYQTISNCGPLLPGTYYVTGNPSVTLSMSLNGDAPGVLLFFTCSASVGGTVVAARCPSGTPPRFTGAGTQVSARPTLTAPGGSGFALVFDQGLARTEGLNSSVPLTIVGDVYGPNVTLRPRGTATALVNGRVVVGSVNGNSSYPWSTMLQVDAPPVTAPGVMDGAVRLVRSN